MTSTLKQLTDWGYSVRLKPNGRLGVTPWSKCTEEHKQWIANHKPQIIQELGQVRRPRPTVSGDKPKQHNARFPVHMVEQRQVGQELAKIIDEEVPGFLVGKHTGCGCSDYAKKMDKWGAKECHDRREEIVSRLTTQADKLVFGARFVPEAIKKHQAAAWLQLAIERCLPTRSRLQDGTVVVTAADARFLGGAYLLAWTLLHTHKVNMVCYDLGIEKNDLTQQMENWGVEFRRPTKLPVSGVRGWQTFNKPFVIEQAMYGADRVLWLDADCTVNAPLLPMEQMTEDKLFLADHGIFKPKNHRNHINIYQHISRPRTKWGVSGPDWPCAGVIGMEPSRDYALLREWQSRILKIQSNGRLEWFSFQDQGALQDIADVPLEDGRIWNNLGVCRDGSVMDFLGMHKDHPEVAVYHAGGHRKPWHYWKRMFWPDPRYTGDFV